MTADDTNPEQQDAELSEEDLKAVAGGLELPIAPVGIGEAASGYVGEAMA